MNNENETLDAKIVARVAEAHAHANAYEAAGCPILAGLLRVEAANIAARPKDWKPIHKPNVGPYTDGKFCYCVNCGRRSKDPLSYDFGEGEERNCNQRLLQ
jgi:hypothetical protein